MTPRPTAVGTDDGVIPITGGADDGAAPIAYRVEVADAHAHLYAVTLTVPQPGDALTVSLPAWIPGSYLVREFARHLQGVCAAQDGRDRAVRQLDKATWRIEGLVAGGGPLVLSWQAYAFDTSVRAAFLDARRGFFNGTSLLLRVHGREHEAHALAIGALPDGWRVATAMPTAPDAADETGPRRFLAADYDELVDHPFELGTFWRGDFTACGVPHAFVVAGAPPRFDGARLLADVARICEAQIAFWHGPQAGVAEVPFARYVFFLHAPEDGYGGLEHRASTALIASRRDLPRRGDAVTGDGYATLLGLISHEYFHAWNVKRLRPADFARYDYTQENYTRLLWFFEGFTSYYDDLLLARAGLIDEARYLKALAKSATSVFATPGRRVQSVAAASFDAWVKYYRGDENTPNATVSYYAKGALIALALDLALRSEGAPGASLDAVMRRLWTASAGGPVAEEDIAAAVREVGGEGGEGAGARIAADLLTWVHGTDDPPLADLLKRAGIAWSEQPPTQAQRWGLRVAESALTGVKATHVLRGGAAERAGLAAGDELLAVNGWRLRRLDDASGWIDDGEGAELLVGRDQRVLTLHLPADAPAGAGAVQLAAQADADDAALALRRAWLHG